MYQTAAAAWAVVCGGRIAGEDGGGEAGFGEADAAGEAADARTDDGDKRAFGRCGRHAGEYSSERSWIWIMKVAIQ